MTLGCLRCRLGWIKVSFLKILISPLIVNDFIYFPNELQWFYKRLGWVWGHFKVTLTSHWGDFGSMRLVCEAKSASEILKSSSEASKSASEAPKSASEVAKLAWYQQDKQNIRTFKSLWYRFRVTLRAFGIHFWAYAGGFGTLLGRFGITLSSLWAHL